MKRREWLQMTAVAPILAFLGVKAKPETTTEEVLASFQEPLKEHELDCVWTDLGQMPVEWDEGLERALRK